jgi:aminoglycoside 2'-N-acetyltransferase I
VIAMDIRTEVRSASSLTDAEKKQLDAIFAAFPDEMDEGRKGSEFQWASAERLVLGYWSDILAVHLCIVERLCKVGGQDMALAGIGGLATHLEYRNRGLGSAAMKRAAALLREEMRADFGHLVCTKEVAPFYARLGWTVVPGPTLVEQPTGQVRLSATAMVLPIRRSDWPGGVTDLCGLPW